MSAKTSTQSDSKGSPTFDASPDAARGRLAGTGRNEPCPCGSSKKYKKCHLVADEAATVVKLDPPKAEDHVTNGWRLFEQRRPGAAEKEFRAALALRDGYIDAIVGVGMSRLSAGDNDGARKEFDAVITASEPAAAKLREAGAKDGFTKPEVQSYIRASHALGCMAYDLASYDECVTALERVYTIDAGTVGIEARLVAAKGLMKLDRAPEAAKVLEPVKEPRSALGRASMGLALARFATGDRTGAVQAIDAALATNPHFGRALLGQVRKHVDQPMGAPQGSKEEAVLYSQTYGDVWDDAAKAFLAETLDARSGEARPNAGAEPSAANAPAAEAT